LELLAEHCLGVLAPALIVDGVPYDAGIGRLEVWQHVEVSRLVDHLKGGAERGE
jgi:hypothetical protein